VARENRTPRLGGGRWPAPGQPGAPPPTRRRPVWNVLEDEGFRLLLLNPAQVKALNGRKSDGRDAQRIAEFLQDGRLTEA